MNTFTRIAAAALIGIGFTSAASAQDAGPYLVGSGENLSVAYPMPSANVVGGASYAKADGSGQGESLRTAGARNAQVGRIATVVGSGENLSVVYETAAPESMQAAQGATQG
ncbi:MAG TPA: hypothetical protein VGN83_13315 [Falsiroseomonas sp.]|jgi:hypothetical protein|nr:hypothetical protein [Falsiroseomonas sp.]